MDAPDSHIRIITDEQVEELLHMRTAIDLMRSAFAALSSGAAVVPIRSRIVNEATGCMLLSMPAGNEETGFVHKAVSVQPANPELGLPSVNGLVTVFHPLTGRPRAIMPAEALTAIRTGAASGLATELLALEDARILAVFGTGPQATTQVEAVCCARNIEHVIVYGRDQSKAINFAKAMANRFTVRCTPATSPELLKEAHVVCTATSSSVPVFADADVAPGCHVNGIGSYRPEMIEVPTGLVRRARVFVDHRDSCLVEAGDILGSYGSTEEAAEAIEGEIGEVVLGQKEGRVAADEVTFFKSVGNGVQDLYAACYVAAAADRDDVGTLLRL